MRALLLIVTTVSGTGTESATEAFSVIESNYSVKIPTAELGYIHNILTSKQNLSSKINSVLTISLCCILRRATFLARRLPLYHSGMCFRGQDEETLYFASATGTLASGVFKPRGADFRQTVKCLDAVRR